MEEGRNASTKKKSKQKQYHILEGIAEIRGKIENFKDVGVETLTTAPLVSRIWPVQRAEILENDSGLS